MSSTGGQSSYITNIADATNINYTIVSTTSTTDSNVLDLLKQGALFLCGQNPSGQFQEIYGRTYAVNYSDLDDNGNIFLQLLLGVIYLQYHRLYQKQIILAE